MRNKLKRLSIALGLILAAGIIFALGMVQPNLEPHDDQYEYAEEPAEEPRPSRAEQVVRALVGAYPRRVLRAEFRNGDWAVLVRDTWFYYAEGRMLPERLRDRASEYSPIAFYNYPSELPPWTAPTPEQISRFRDVNNERAIRRPRATYFFDALYRAHNRNEAYDRVKSRRFLGHPVMVHYAILEDLSLVEEQILAAARTDTEVRAWINNIGSMVGWNWRNVAGTQSRSFHAYGVAVDILPRSTGGRAIYWLWAGPDWWNIPHERRYHPPDVVIRAFESQGFVWGGKWLFFDAMHFEYRPEVIILNGMELSTLR